jgi:hypothetical protein
VFHLFCEEAHNKHPEDVINDFMKIAPGARRQVLNF